MEISKLLSFINIDENGKVVVDEAAYKAEAQSELDKARQQASDTSAANTEKKLRAEIEKEVKVKLEEEAKLSAEEKLEAERKKFAEEKRAFDTERIKAIYTDAGMSEAEIEVALGLIGDDSVKNLETARKFADARKAANEQALKQFQEDLQKRTPHPNGGGSDGGEESLGAQQAKRFAEPAKSNDYVDLSGRGKQE